MKSINLTNAFVVTQFFLLVITFVGIAVLQRGENQLTRMPGTPRPASQLFYPVFGFALVTVGILVFTQDVLLFSRPVFGDLDVPGIGKSTAFLLVFVFDLLGAAILIKVTGGSGESPFSAILFTLPALSIFLREPPSRFFGYTIGAALLFLLVQSSDERGIFSNNPKYKNAFVWVTLMILALSTLVGYATRPI
ncbi:MAG: hypothetical protein V4563_04480 [Pseudomonadota bacterium]